MATGGCQRTLAAPTHRIRGVGMHSGYSTSMRLMPASVDAGITFVRTDCADARIPLRVANVRNTMLATTVVLDDIAVATIEHLLSALCACGVDNVDIELDGPEVPIMDGSARPFVTILQDVGLVESTAQKRFLRITQSISVELNGNRCASFEPYAMACWDISIDFKQPVVRATPSHRVFELSSNAAYVAEIARARTYGFVEDLDTMRDHGRAQGGSLDNALVLDRTSVYNEEGLRQADEFVCHKLLDAIGDTYSEGLLVIGRYRAVRPGHELNHRLMRLLLDTPASYEVVTAAQLEQQPDYGPLLVAAL